MIRQQDAPPRRDPSGHGRGMSSRPGPGTLAPRLKLPSRRRGGIEGEVRQDLERGLHFAHIMLMVNQNQGNRAVASVEALVAVLAAKGLIRPEQLAEPLEQAC